MRGNKGKSSFFANFARTSFVGSGIRREHDNVNRACNLKMSTCTGHIDLSTFDLEMPILRAVLPMSPPLAIQLR
jgi:hypothetical protein